MPSSTHVRSDSSDTTSSTGSSYQLILDHILSYPGSYEIPLRSMYALNCNSRVPGPHPRTGTPPSNASSPITPQGVFPEDRNTQSFSDELMAQIQQLPSQPNSLPPSFVTSFLRNCFSPTLENVDFPQALTGLDYLKDLETRRRREVAAAMDRLEIDRDMLDTDADSLSSKYPGVAAWVKTIEEKERKIDALYTQLYVGLRRWILINELSLIPYNKYNCVAMLNTLYPPVVSAQPTSRLTREILTKQRDGFFKYIQAVEKSGTQVLHVLMQQGKAPTDGNGWSAVNRTLGLYLQLANSMVDECSEISERQDVGLQKRANSTSSQRQTRKADSGCSFSGAEIPSTRTSSFAEPASPTETARPKTPSGSRHNSALEKIARGLKTIGRGKTDATEMISEPVSAPAATAGKPKLRKMRSMGAIEGRNRSKPDVSTAPAFDPAEMRRQRLKYEAGIVAAQKFGRHQSHEI